MSGAFVVTLLVWGCGGEPGDDVDASTVDASVDAEAIVDGGREVDTGPIDGGAGVDGGADLDATTADAAMPDGGPCVIVSGAHSGQATVYGPASATQCGAGLTAWTTLRVAVSSTALMGGARCGACMRITGPGGTHVALIDDECFGCAANDLDLQPDAAMAILGATDGRHPVTWEFAPCAPPGNVFYDFQGSNPFYVKIRVSQHVTPVEGLELRAAGDVWMAAARTADGFFELTPGGAFPLPLGVRVTDVFGSTIEFEAPDLSSPARDSGEQFPLMCAP